MISKFVREQKRYTQVELCDIFECSEEKAVRLIRKLKEYGVLKVVKRSAIQRDMSELFDEDVEIVDVEIDDNEFLYVFTYVGIITISGRVLKCYPKYLMHNSSPITELRQVLKVIEKYKATEQNIRIFNDSSESKSFNLLAILLFLMQDYYDNGVYSATEEIIESNGTGEILWDKTINETFALISNNRPYYIDIKTKKRKNDDFDYFKRLHECVITKASNELRDADLLEIFEISEIALSDEDLEDFGERDYILYRIERELDTQFNTRKQLLLKTIFVYISNGGSLNDFDSFSMFGTNCFNLVWEKVCSEVMDNKLQQPIGSLQLPVYLSKRYREIKHRKLIELIDKPQWSGVSSEGHTFVKQAEDTLVPDIISIVNVDGDFQFIIFDAKYYNIQLEHDKKLRGQPGIESITKQYLYQLAYQPFVEEHQIHTVRNCFLMPIATQEIVEKGAVAIDMLSGIGLQDIQVRLLPAEKMYRHYIENTKMDIRTLNL